LLNDYRELDCKNLLLAGTGGNSDLANVSDRELQRSMPTKTHDIGHPVPADAWAQNSLLPEKKKYFITYTKN
jgi:hypothetical protein